MQTIEESIAACKAEMEATIKSKHTVRAYKKGLDILVLFLQDEYHIQAKDPLSTIDIDKFIRFPVWVLQHSPTRETALVRGSAAKWFLDKWLIQNRLIDPSYSDGKRLELAMKNITKRSAKLPKRVPGDGDIEKVVMAAKSMGDKEPTKSLRIALVSFLATSGLRAQELVDLKCRDINLVKTEVFVRGGKEDKDRIVPFAPETAVEIQKYWAARGWSFRDDPAFASHSRKVKPGTRVPMTTNAVRSMIEILRKVSGVEGELTPHYFRHYFASRVLEMTGNIKLVRDLLGHSDISVTEIYIHLDTKDKHKGHDKAFSDWGK